MYTRRYDIGVFAIYVHRFIDNSPEFKLDVTFKCIRLLV